MFNKYTYSIIRAEVLTINSIKVIKINHFMLAKQ